MNCQKCGKPIANSDRRRKYCDPCREIKYNQSGYCKKCGELLKSRLFSFCEACKNTQRADDAPMYSAQNRKVYKIKINKNAAVINNMPERKEYMKNYQKANADRIKEYDRFRHIALKNGKSRRTRQKPLVSDFPPALDIYKDILSGKLSRFPAGYWEQADAKENAKILLRYLLLLTGGKLSNKMATEYKVHGMVKALFNNRVKDVLYLMKDRI